MADVEPLQDACAGDFTDEQEKLISRLVIIIAELMMLAIFGLTFFLSTRDFMAKVSIYAPHSTFMIILGLVLGAILDPINDSICADLFGFEHEFFFSVLLPPIILGAGFSVRKDHFFHNFGSILTLAFVGTAISTGVIGGLMCAVGNMSGVYQFEDTNDCFILGSLISAVDPIATVVVLKSLGVDPHLYVLIFGESVLNDAVAIVINRVFVEAKGPDKGENPGIIIVSIIASAAGSMAIGLLFGFIGAYIHRKTRLHLYTTLEIGFFFLIAFIPYEIAELCELSGIMAILFTGIVADHYTSYNLSKHSETTCRELVEVLAFAAESFVFVYLGMTPFTYDNHVFEPAFIGFLLLFCLLGRAAAVFPLSIMLNFGRKHKISGRQMLVIWFAGLRGPIAFALALASPESERGVMVTSTLAIVMITTVVFGGATMPVLSKLELTVDENGEGSQVGDEERKNADENLSIPSNYSYKLRPSVGTASAIQRAGYKDSSDLQSNYGIQSTYANATRDVNRPQTDQWDNSAHWFTRLHTRYLAPMFRDTAPTEEDGEQSQEQLVTADQNARKGSQDLDGIELKDAEGTSNFLTLPEGRAVPSVELQPTAIDRNELPRSL